MTENPEIERAYWVLAPEPDVRLGLQSAARWEAQAQNFFGVALQIREDCIRVAEEDVAVRVWQPESCASLLSLARAASASMGGFDALVARTRSVLEIDARAPRAGLLVAAIAASILLGPIVTPEGALLGVKSARERLAHFGQE
jgi:hypothetical protein